MFVVLAYKGSRREGTRGGVGKRGPSRRAWHGARAGTVALCCLLTRSLSPCRRVYKAQTAGSDSEESGSEEEEEEEEVPKASSPKAKAKAAAKKPAAKKKVGAWVHCT